MTINTNPAKNVKNRQATTTPFPASSESEDYVYEDNVPDSRGFKKSRKRSKRAVMSPRQRDCTCRPPLSFNQDTAGEENIKPTEGCTGGTNAVDAAGMATAGGCGGRVPSAAPAQFYATAGQYYQYYYTPPTQYSQYVPYYPQYSQPQQPQQSFASPCRVGEFLTTVST